MKSNHLLSLLCIFLASVVVVSCSEDEDPDGNNGKVYPKAVLNISDAASLAVLEGGAGRATETASNFYKIKTNGSMEEVKFVTADGSELDASITPVVNVTGIINLDDEFLLLSGTFAAWDSTGNGKSYNSLLVRKNDGAIFDFIQNDINVSKTKLGDNVIKHDAAGNIYYPNNTGVTKLSVNDPENITKEEYLASGQTAQFFEITPEGAAVYKYGENSSGATSSNGTDQIRIRKPNGGIFEVQVEGRDNKQFWLGTNGATYLITYTWDNGYLPAIHKITLVGGNPEITKVWHDETMSYPGVGNMLRGSTYGAYKINKEHSVVFVDTYYSASGTRSWEFDEETNSVTNIELPQIEEGAIIVSSNDYYYIATGTDLYKVNLDTHEYSSLLNSGEYEVYSMNVDASNKVQFSGLRFSDGKKIFAEISSAGAFKILDEEIGRSATVLQRLD